MLRPPPCTVFASLLALLLCAGGVTAQEDVSASQPLFSDTEEAPVVPNAGSPPAGTFAAPGQAQISESPPLAPVDDPNARYDAGAPPSTAAAPTPLPVLSLIPNTKVLFGGTVTGDFLFSSKRPVAPGTPFFLTPGSPTGADTQTFDALARQSALFALFRGPEIGCWETGGLVLVNFYDNTVIADRYGLLPIEAFGHLKNDDWRLAAGLQLDIFNPRLPTVLPFSLLAASGNVGIYRGQARVERYLYLDDETQVTIQAGLSEPIATFLTDSFRISEDNGWPNVEGRVMLGLGEQEGMGLLAHRPLELAVSGVVGQLRTVDPIRRVVASVWGFGVDGKWQITERFGTKGEFYVGQGLGTYGGAILQTINTVTFEPVRSAGGWLEGYYYWCDEVHTHVGYGIDSAARADLALGQRSFNDTLFANVIWDITKTFRVALEGTYRTTDYVVLRDNQGFTVHTQVQWKF